MRFKIAIDQYTALMQHYSSDGVTLDGGRTLTMLLREYNIRFINMDLAGSGYIFEAMDPTLYTLYALRWG
jgi:hypothetical protein